MDADYTEAGFGNRIGFGERPVLNIVDLTMAYLDSDSPLYAGVEAELAVTERLVESARKHNIPVVFSRVEYEPGGADGGHFYKKVSSLKVFDRGRSGAAPSCSLPWFYGERMPGDNCLAIEAHRNFVGRAAHRAASMPVSRAYRARCVASLPYCRA